MPESNKISIFSWKGVPSGNPPAYDEGHYLDDRDVSGSGYYKECIQGRLKAFRRPVHSYPKSSPSDYRIQDSYIHHKSSWDGYDRNDDGHIEIMFLSRAKESKSSFNRYDKYSPNINGYYDALFVKPPSFDYLNENIIDGDVGDDIFV